MEGLSGAGKSSVYEELIRRGYRAVSTDRAWKVHPDTGRPLHDDALWDEQKALSELERLEPDVLFVCGSSGNRDRFQRYFAKIFNLRIDDDTMRRRLRERTNNDFGKQPEEVELMLGRNRSGDGPAGAIDVDATKPLDQVVDEVLRLADCRTATSDSPPTPWSRRGPATGRSFVIPESALPIGEPPDALWDVLRRETITRIEYSWSGDVLATLLQYLDEQGIDLIDADQEGSVFVLTPDHRERYMARLDPSAFDGAVLERCYEELNGTAADGVGYAMLDGIAFFRDMLEALGHADVAVVVIG